MVKEPRPIELGGLTIKQRTGCGNMYIQLNWKNNRLFEIFATLGHSGGCGMCYSEALTRSITTGLRSGVPIEDYIDQLKGIQCPNPLPFPKEEAVISCPDAIARALTLYGKLSIKDVVQIIIDSNPPEEGFSPEQEREQAINTMEKQAEERERLGL